MKKTIVKNAKVVTADGLLEGAAISFRNGRIDEVGYFNIPDSTDFKVVDAEGGYALAGFIETHVHGGGGFDFMDGSVEAFRKIVNNHASHGTTSICPTTIACKEEEMFRLFEVYREAGTKELDASLLGIHLEGPFISQTMKGAQPESWVRCPSKREIDRIVDEAGDIVVRCSMAPEIEGTEYAAKKLKSAGIGLSIAHSDAVAEDIFKAYDMGFDHITHFYCSNPTVRKIGQVRYAGIIEAAYLLDGMTVDLIGDGKHIPKTLMQTVLKLKGVDNVAIITDAMRAAGTDVKESYLGRECPEARVIIEDGVAKLPDRSSFAGSIATSDVALRTIVGEFGFDICDASKMMSALPARLCGVANKKGMLKKGYDADIVLINDQYRVTSVWSMGKKI